MKKTAKAIADKIVKMEKAGLDYTAYIEALMANQDIDFNVISEAMAIAGRRMYPETIK